MSRQPGSIAYRMGAAVALFASALQVWINLAVGIVAVGTAGN